MIATSVIATAQVAILNRVDMTQGDEPYFASAFFLPNGWQVWSFGWTNKQTATHEVGKMFKVSPKLQFGAFLVSEPDVNRNSIQSWLTYQDKAFGGELTLYGAFRQPFGKGSRIVFSDNSSLIWRNRKGTGAGLTAFYWKTEGFQPTLRLGPALEVPLKRGNLTLSYQPLYLEGKGNPIFRVQVTLW